MANSVDPDQTADNGEQSRPDQTAKKGKQFRPWLYYLEWMANSVDPDQNATNGKYCRPWSNCWEWQTVLTLMRLLKIINSVDTDQTENGK